MVNTHAAIVWAEINVEERRPGNQLPQANDSWGRCVPVEALEREVGARRAKVPQEKLFGYDRQLIVDDQGQGVLAWPLRIVTRPCLSPWADDVSLMSTLQDQSSIGKRVTRDARVDALRGFALLCIFVDHIPRDVLNAVTLRNFGFSDAAELFVLLAGFASMMAYGRSFARDGTRGGLWRIVQRCGRLYLFQIGLLLATLGIVWAWSKYFDFEPRTLGPMLHGGVRALVPGLTLRAQPSNLNILPFYILLLGLFPLIYAAIRVSPGFALLVSAAIWVLVGIYPNLNLTNGFDGNFWFFDPLSWQFIFTIGAVAAAVMAANGGALPSWRWLTVACWLFLGFAFLQVFPWTSYGLPNPASLRLEPPDKTHLAALRLLHALALAYVVLTSHWSERVVQHAVGRLFALCGRNSLEVFSLGTLLALVGRLAMRTYGDGWGVQIAVNLAGILGMIALAAFRERSRVRPATSPRPYQSGDTRSAPPERWPA